MEENTNNQNQPQPQPQPIQSRGYGKRPIWQWIVAYVILGLVAYGLIYYFAVVKPKNNQQGQNNNQSTQVASVTISNNQFVPSDLTISKGTKVVWTNNDNVTHTVTADKDGPMSPELKKGDSYSDIFTEVGTFSYHCSIHPNMKGTIHVVE